MPTSKTVFVIRHRGNETGADEARPHTVVEVDGDLDVGSAPGFRAVVEDLVDDTRVAVDLTGCPTIDQRGLDALVAACRRMVRTGGDFTAIGAPPEAAAALAAAGCPRDRLSREAAPTCGAHEQRRLTLLAHSG